MNLNKTTGRIWGTVVTLLTAAALLIVPLVSYAGSEKTDGVTSQVEDYIAAPEEAEISHIPVIEEVLPPTSLLRPVIDIPTVQKTNDVSVGLYYGNGSVKEITLSAAEGAMLNFDSDVNKSLTFTHADGKMYVNGKLCEKAYVRSSAPITLSTTGWGYEGMLVLYPNEYGITVVNRLDLETYVKGVMSAEIGADGSYESRKAFAVICRTLVYVAKDHGEDFDLCNRNCCQSYRGTHHRDELNDKAVDDTAGIVITYNGVPCLVSYSSSHGYNSCSSFAAWVGADIPYLRVVRYENEPLDYGGQWDVAYTAQQLNARLGGYTTTGQVQSISIKETDPFGGTYVYILNVTDTAGNVSEIKFGGSIMAVLGIRSANFTIENTADGVILHGIGNGHGVGYSQRGGHQMGVDGYSWEQILDFYFPGTARALCENFQK